LTVLVPDYYPTGTAPANPIVLTGGVAAGTQCQVNMAWTAGTVLSLVPAGGAVRLGSGAWIANGSVATALSSVGPTGSHTTVQEWFMVTNSSGVVRYIPAF